MSVLQKAYIILFWFFIIRFKLDLVVLVPTIGVLKQKVLLQISVCKIIDHLRVNFSLYLKASLSAKSLL